jgi:protoheme IX farnesyltransferase
VRFEYALIGRCFVKPDAVVYQKPRVESTSRSKVGDVLTLAKVRVNALVVATTAGGYYMGASVVDVSTLIAAALGTALVASGAAAVNQVTERDTDRLMARTRLRPVADGRMTAGEGWLVALLLSVTGLVTLWVSSGAAASFVALATLLLYALVYTPLKRRTSLSTVVGAVPGALPPLIGWAAAGASLSGAQPWALFVISFVWQMPHVLAIGWMYREDYARAGLPILPVIDPHGGLTGRQATLWAATLVPASQAPYLLGMTDATYAIGALLLGIAQLVVALRFARHRSEVNARALFYASISYLPLLWILMVLGKQ